MTENNIFTIRGSGEQVMIVYPETTYILGQKGIDMILKAVYAAWKQGCEFKVGNVVFAQSMPASMQKDTDK